MSCGVAVMYCGVAAMPCGVAAMPCGVAAIQNPTHLSFILVTVNLLRFLVGNFIKLFSHCVQNTQCCRMTKRFIAYVKVIVGYSKGISCVQSNSSLKQLAETSPSSSSCLHSMCSPLCGPFGNPA